VDLAAVAGLVLDPWQQHVLKESLGERADGKWSAFEVGLIVSRQNGKGSILEARELAGLFLFGERLILHSAHEFKTAADAFRRLMVLVESNPDFEARVAKVTNAHGSEGIELKGGQRIRFVARTSGSGRGFSADTVVLDEAYNLSDAQISALMPTLTTSPNPQIWYTSSAVNAEEHPNGWVLGRLRERGLKGDDPSLAFFEWSADEDAYRDADGLVDVPRMSTDPEAWAAANPGLGFRVTGEHIAREQRSMEPKAFTVERLSVGDWPTEASHEAVIDMDVWKSLADPHSKPLTKPVSFALDLSPNRKVATLTLAGRRADGLAHLEVVPARKGGGAMKGTNWVVDRLVELNRDWKPCAIVINGKSPAASLLPALQAAGLELKKDGGPLVVTHAGEMAQACGAFYDDVTEESVAVDGRPGRLRHLGDPILTTALADAKKRPLVDAWGWDRKSFSGDITAIVSGTLALHGLAVHGAVNDGPPNLW